MNKVCGPQVVRHMGAGDVEIRQVGLALCICERSLNLYNH